VPRPTPGDALGEGVLNTGVSMELRSVKNPDSSGSSGVVKTGISVELRSVKNPDSSGSSGLGLVSSASEVEETIEVAVRLDKGPVYETDDKLELVRPIPALMVFVLASPCEVDRLVL
jgi:hypothetical protein